MKKIHPLNPRRPYFQVLLLGIFSLLITVLPGGAQITTVYSDSFTGSGVLSNATVETSSGTLGGTASATWLSGATYQRNGTLSAVARTMALLPFKPQANQKYELSATVSLANSGFLGIGYCTNVSFTAAAAQNDGNNFRMITVAATNFGMMFVSGTATMSVYSNAANTVIANGIVTSNSSYNLKIALYTGGANWSNVYSLNGSFVTNITYPGTTPVSHIGFTDGNALTTATFDNFKLTAISVFATNTVTYSGNGNDGGTAPVDVVGPYTNSATVTVLAQGTLTKSGYTFSGWNTAADGSGTAYAAAATFAISAGGSTLYAQWAAPSAVITAPATFPIAVITITGTASSSTSVAVSGSGLTAGITATAPANLEVSTNNLAFGSVATLAQSGGIASGTLYVRLAATAPLGTYNSSNVVLTSIGATTVNVATTASGNYVTNTAVWSITTTPATWEAAGNWVNSIVGIGAGNTADLNQVNITADTTVNLTAPLTIGTLIFGDTDTGSAAGWILANNATPANTLTVANVTVNTLGTAKTATISAIVAGASGLTKAGVGTLALSGANTYSGATTINAGALTLSGNRTAASAAMTVGTDANVATLNIQGGNFTFGANTLNVGSGAFSNAVINHTSGDIAFELGSAILVGTGTAGNAGVFNMSGGSVTVTNLTAANMVRRGIILGTQAGTSGILNQNGGNLLLGAIMIARFDSAANNTTGAVYQTSGTTTLGTVALGSRAGSSGGNAILVVTGGTFSATNFTGLAAGDSDVATMLIGGTADVTLPAFPTARGAGATASIAFNGGTLRPHTNSTAYMSGLNNAYLTTNGANFNVASGNDITVAQMLEDAPAQAGVLTKAGAGALTLRGTNTYTGATTISGGTLIIGLSGSIANTAGITNNATLNFNRTSGALPLTVAAVISGTGQLTKTGVEPVTLTAVNTYSGDTLISVGTLALSGAGSIANSPVITANGSLDVSGVAFTLGGTQMLKGTGNVKGAATVNGTIAPGASIGTLTFSNAPSLSGTIVAEVNYTNTPANADNLTLTTGTLTYGGDLVVTNLGPVPTNGTVFTIFTAGGYGGSFSTITLPTGNATHWKTNNLLVNGSIAFSNTAPTASNFDLGVAVGGSTTAAVIGKHVTDAEGDAVTVTGFSVSPTNGTVSIVGGTNIVYTSTNSAAGDSFTYTVSDGFTTSSGTVTVSTYSPQGFNRLSPTGTITNGVFTLTYLGIPGYSYAIEHATNLTPPIVWTPIITNQAATNGYLIFNVTNSGDVNFFRTSYVP